MPPRKLPICIEGKRAEAMHVTGTGYFVCFTNADRPFFGEIVPRHDAESIPIDGQNFTMDQLLGPSGKTKKSKSSDIPGPSAKTGKSKSSNIPKKDLSRKRQRTSTTGSSNPDLLELQEELQRVKGELQQANKLLSAEKDSSRKRQRTSTAGSSNPEQSELQDELQRVTEELKQTKTSLSTDSAKLVETGVLLTTSKAKVKELQSLVETYKSTASGTTRRIKELEDSVKSHESRMKDMAAALYLAQTGHRNAAAERQRFKIISKELDARVNGLNRRIKDTDAELQKAAEDRQANISYYKLAIDKCNKTIAGLQGKISDLESKGKEGEGQLGEATAEAVKWKEKVEELSGKVDSLSAECMQLRNENKEVVERYGQREKALATRHNQRMKDTVPQEVDGGDIMAIVGDLVPADDSLQKSPLSQDAQKELIASLVTSSDASAVDAVRKLYTSGVVQLPDIVEAPDGKIGTMKMVSPGKHIVVQTNSLDTVTQAAECLMRNPQRFGDRINRESWRAILGDEDEANRDMAPYIREICPAAAAVFSGELLLGKDIPYPEGENAVCRLDYAGLLNPDFISVMCANHDDEISAFFGTMGELSISAAYYS